MQELIDLKKTVAKLRAPDGCPWDREQTHLSLTGCLIEECSEVLDTIEREDFEHMREELGDLLLQVVMHAQLAEESGYFCFEDTAREINEKLIRRHPHVFGDGTKAGNSEEVLVQWEKIKANEKKEKNEPESLFKNLPNQLPALLYARDVYKQIAKKELNASGLIDEDNIKKLGNSLSEDEVGEQLFELASASRLAGIDPEAALRRYSKKVMKELESRHSGD
jgi:XTP/dITP diphosphohydrolase/tetrapyrrole methylase family protein/MazG family protein